MDEDVEPEDDEIEIPDGVDEEEDTDPEDQTGEDVEDEPEADPETPDPDATPDPAIPAVDAPAAPAAPTNESAPVFVLPAAPEVFNAGGIEYAVSADGDTLDTPMFADQNSDAAQTLINSLVEQFDGDENRAMTEYRYLQTQYERAKSNYEQQRTHIVERSLGTAAQAHAVRVQQVDTEVRDVFLAGISDEAKTEILSEFKPLAMQAINATREQYIDQLVGEGYTPQRARVKVDAALLGNPDLYRTALGNAAVQNLAQYTQSVINAVYKQLGVDPPKGDGAAAAPPSISVGGTPAKVAAAPVNPAPSRQPRPPAPGVGAAPSAGRAIAADGQARERLVATKSEVAAARDMGMDRDPKMMARFIRNMRNIG